MKATKKILYTFILSVLLLLACKLILPQPNKNKVLINEFWVSKTHNSSKKNIVIAGDSRMYRGLSPHIMLNQISDSLAAINLGYPGAGFSLEYLNFAFNRIDKKAKHKVLILGISPNSLTPVAAQNEFFHQYFDISKFDQFKALNISVYLKHFAPYSPAKLIKNLFNVNTGANYYQNFNADGWVRSAKTPEDSTFALSYYKRQLSANKVDLMIIDSLIVKVREIIEEGVSVVAFRPPSTVSLEEIEDSLCGFSYIDLIFNLEKVGCNWIDNGNERFRSYDGSHLHYEGAEKLSIIVGKKINDLLKLD